MAKRRNPTSDIIPPENPLDYERTIPVCFEIPDNRESRVAVRTVLYGLTRWLAYSETGDRRGADQADAMKQTLLKTLRFGEECMCNCNNNCVCDLVALIQNQIDLTVAINVPQPPIPPDNPGENYPPIDTTDGDVADKRDAYLCDMSKLWAATIFEALYQTSLEYCENQRSTSGINWTNIATGVGVIIATLALGPGGGVAAKTLFGLAIAAGLAAVGDEVQDYLENSGSGDCGDVVRFDNRIIDAYGCQLFNSVFGSINFTSFRDAFSTQSPDTIAAYVAAGFDPVEANEADNSIRPLLAEFNRNGDAFQAFIQSISAAAENPYYDGQICADCVTIDPQPIDISSWTDARIISITPAPTISGPGDIRATWPANGWDEIVITFDNAYSVDSWQGTIVRGATVGVPNAAEYQINNRVRMASFGGFGPNTEVFNFDDEISRVIRIRPGNTQSSQASLALQFSGNNLAAIRVRQIT